MQTGSRVITQLSKESEQATEEAYRMQQAADELTLQLTKVSRATRYQSARADQLKVLATEAAKLTELDDEFEDIRKKFYSLWGRIKRLFGLT